MRFIWKVPTFGYGGYGIEGYCGCSELDPSKVDTIGLTFK